MTIHLRFALLFVLLTGGISVLAEETVRVTLDTSEVPHLNQWGEDAKALIIRWHPRVSNLLATKGFKLPRSITLKIRKSDKGVGGTSGTTITLSSSWIEKHPKDFGLVLHELVHVIQAYPSGNPWWVTEGIADYLRWAIYEGKQLKDFPRPKDKQGYKRGYQATGGFLLWLESDRAPGIVRKLNTAMRKGKFTPAMFGKETSLSLDELWAAYLAEN